MLVRLYISRPHLRHLGLLILPTNKNSLIPTLKLNFEEIERPIMRNLV